MATTKPDLTRIWASGAPGANIEDPDVTSPGKFAAGWVAEVPPFENFNFLQQLYTQGLLYINENGLGEWDTDTTYPIGGLVRGSDDEYYIAVLEQAGNDPASDDGTNWVLWITSKSGTVEVTVVTVSDATFAPDPLAKAIKFTAIGGGGGGGGVDGQGSGTSSVGAGGGSGGASLKITSSIDPTYNITIGAGGNGGADTGGNGTSGGTTSVVDNDTGTTVNIQATGGAGGDGMVGTSGSDVSEGGFAGVGSGGDLNPAGDDGSQSSVISGDPGQMGDSGGGYLGGKRRGRANNVGRNGISSGSGGGGAGFRDVATNGVGGDGADGVVIVEEFF